jgi:hypothetical protein
MNKIGELKKRYLDLFLVDGISKDAINEVEKGLNLQLPPDFCEISEFYSGGMLGDVSLFSFIRINNAENIIDETIRLRKTAELPHEYIVLAEPSESIIVLKTQHNPIVLWIDAVEIARISDMAFESVPDKWNSFSDFFNTLLQQEEEDQNVIYQTV